MATMLVVQRAENINVKDELFTAKTELEVVTNERDASIEELNSTLQEKHVLEKENSEYVKANEDLTIELSEAKDKNVELKEEVSDLGKEIVQLKKKNTVTTSSSSKNNSSQVKKKTSKPASSTKSSSKWRTMTVEASAYTLVKNGDKLGGTGLTSTGAVPTANRTIAVDPTVIPYGSLIKYNGVTYTAEDTGGMIKGNKVDIFMNTLEECLTFGRKDIEIQVMYAK